MRRASSKTANFSATRGCEKQPACFYLDLFVLHWLHQCSPKRLWTAYVNGRHAEVFLCFLHSSLALCRTMLAWLVHSTERARERFAIVLWQRAQPVDQARLLRPGHPAWATGAFSIFLATQNQRFREKANHSGLYISASGWVERAADFENRSC